LVFYHLCTIFVPMSGENEYIHFRITKILSEILNKISFDTGMSKQDIIRQMIIDRISEKYNVDLLMDVNEIKNKILNHEKTVY